MKPVTILKIALALLSVTCIFNIPYGYYQLYRFIALGSFIYLAYAEQEDKGWMIVWLISALLVQPFFKASLGREVWILVDIIWAILLVISALKSVRSNRKKVDYDSVVNNSISSITDLVKSPINWFIVKKHHSNMSELMFVPLFLNILLLIVAVFGLFGSLVDFNRGFLVDDFGDRMYDKDFERGLWGLVISNFKLLIATVIYPSLVHLYFYLKKKSIS